MHKYNFFAFFSLYSFVIVIACNTSQNKNDLKINEVKTISEAITELKIGNQRFIDEKQLYNKNYKFQINNTKLDQHPFAFILGCIDSRVPPEIIFDQPLGNLFVSRIAGNVDDSFVIASMEYAAAIKQTKLFVVLGHSHCGAVNGALTNIELGHITELSNQIESAISENHSYPMDDLKADLTTKKSVNYTIQHIKARSKIINSLVQENKILIVGAFYNIETGKVEFLQTN
jgi:carbonic anhydrase